MKFHPLADIFPLIDGDDFNSLVADVRQHGVREPIVIFDGRILDGRNRWRAAQAVGVECPRVDFTGSDPVGFVISLNLRRRHLDESQRAMVAGKLATLTHGGDRVSEQAASLPVATQARAAEVLNVSERSVRSARAVLDHGAPELVRAVEAGAVSVSAAADVASLPQPVQAEIVARGEREILDAAKRIRTEKAEKRQVEIAELKRHQPALPTGRYECIVIDPPWQMAKIERDVRPNQIEFDYPTMDEGELAALGIAALAEDDCHLFCWTTHKHLPQALRLLDAWGFRYVCTMVWHKPGGFQPIGLPQYNCEFVLYARRGAPTFADTKAFPVCFNAPRREHSRKPDEFYDLIRRVTGGPRIDVFSREKRDGFDQFGNETEKFAA